MCTELRELGPKPLESLKSQEQLSFCWTLAKPEGTHNTPSPGHTAQRIPLAKVSSSPGYLEEWQESGEDQTTPWKRQGSENNAIV